MKFRTAGDFGAYLVRKGRAAISEDEMLVFVLQILLEGQKQQMPESNTANAIVMIAQGIGLINPKLGEAGVDEQAFLRKLCEVGAHIRMDPLYAQKGWRLIKEMYETEENEVIKKGMAETITTMVGE